MPSRSSVILGLSFGHGDSSAALIVDGQLVAAAEEERFNRIKHYALFPTQAVQYCLRHAGIRAEDVAVVAIPRKPSKHLTRRLLTYWRHPSLFAELNARRKSRSEGFSEWAQKQGLGRARIFRCEHHLAHMASVRYLDPSEPMALLTLDGLGDFVSTAMAVANERIQIQERIFFPHSLGFFYTAMTQYLGFPYYGDEFKVMGLSSFGTPRYLPILRELIREGDGFKFELNLEAFPILKSPIRFRIESGQPSIQPFYSANFLTQCLGLPPRNPKRQPIESTHRDLAKSVQCRFEEIADHLLQQVHIKSGLTSLGLAGGCAHNSVWVGKIPRRAPFKKVFVAPASHDAGTAVGAAILAMEGTVQVEGGHWGLLGPEVGELESATVDNPASSSQPAARERDFSNTQELANWIAERLAQGETIGLVQGRMEFGPRALGSRSILADPRYPGMKDRLNERVKHRETFRPFAASVLEEFRDDWFQHAFPSPHMEAVFDVKPASRSLIQAVVHADNSCRIQTVTKSSQPFFWEIIEAFRRLTGVPMIINTSFNDSEPIVASRTDAIRCFAATDLDHLVIDQKVYSKSATRETRDSAATADSQPVTA